VSKTSAALDKWLILRAYEQTDANIGPRDTERNPSSSCAAPGPPLRSPSGESGLPCDWLFSVASEPVIIVDAATEHIVQANPAAAELLGTSLSALLAAPILEAFEISSKTPITDAMERARSAPQAETKPIRAAGNGAEVAAKVSLFYAGGEAYLLVRLASIMDHEALGTTESPVFDAIEGASVGFLVTDAGLRVEYANQAFIDMVKLAPSTAILGKSLASWLEFSERDMAQLHNQMLQRQATTAMTAHLRSERSSPRPVEVCAVAVPNGQLTCWGFTVRELPSLN
jgi:PAS domain-containing protein